ncbi:MAG: acyl carrier protein [Lentisphaerae bacterium]|mgnify:FL=1|jgi:acyl carrier protein|nr:acyl carrier protein [Lentisphaerota bacterium]
MSELTLEDQIKELLVERLFLDLEPSQIQNETLLSEYGVDSFLMLELVVAMEEIFAVHFEPADITAAALKTVSSLATLIRSKQHQQS